MIFLLTITGTLSILLLGRSVLIAESNLLEAIVLRIFGFFSFILTAILTNGVAP